jgi:hypothetical protein
MIAAMPRDAKNIFTDVLLLLETTDPGDLGRAIWTG